MDLPAPQLRAPLGQGGVEPLVFDVHLHRAPLPELSPLGGEGQEGDPVQKGVAYAGGHVGGPRPQRGKAGPGAAGQASVDIGHEAGASLMGDQDELHGAAVQSLQKTGVLASRVSEEVADPGPRQKIDDHFPVAPHLTLFPRSGLSTGEMRRRRPFSRIPSQSRRIGQAIPRPIAAPPRMSEG